MTTIDFNTLFNNTPEISAVPAGKYQVVVEKAEAVRTKQTDLPMLKLTLSIIGGPQNNRKLFDNVNITSRDEQKAPIVQRFFFRKMAAFGLGFQEYLSQNPTMEQLAQALVGRQAEVDVKIEKWNGEDQSRVSGYSKASATAPGPAAAPAAPGSPTGIPTAAPVAAPVLPVAAPVAAPVPVAPVPAPVVAVPAVAAPTPVAAPVPQTVTEAPAPAAPAPVQLPVEAPAAPAAPPVAAPVPAPAPEGYTPPEPPAATFI